MRIPSSPRSTLSAVVGAWACVLLVPNGASGQEASSSPEEMAVYASRVHAEYCEGPARTSPEATAAAIAAAAPAYGAVARAYARHGAVYLLYWRGRLAACLSREAEAEADLRGFLAAAGRDPTYQRMAGDARRWLASSAPTSSRPPGRRARLLTPGVVLAASGAGLLIPGAIANAESYRRAGLDPETGTHSLETAEYDRLVGVNRAGLGLVIAGGVISTVGIVLTVAGASHRQQISLHLTSTGDGVLVGLALAR